MNANDPDLLIWWFLGVLPLAYLTRSRAILSLAILVALGGLGWKASEWLDFDGGSQYQLFGLYLSLGAAVYALGMLQSRFTGTAIHSLPFAVFGALTVFIFLYILSFDAVYGDLRYYSGKADLPGGIMATISVSAALAIVSAAASLIARRGREAAGRALPYETGAVLVVLGCVFLIAFLPFSSAAAYVAVFNLVLFMAIIGVIVLGFLARREALVNVGFVFFAIDLTTRYVELTWDMLKTSLFFMVGGVVLLVGGFLLERTRRGLMRRLGLVEVEDES